MVTIDILKAKGYPVSALKSQESITLAEKRVILAYFPKDTDFEKNDLNDVVCALTFALMLRNSAMATRFGATVKVDGYSQKIEEEKSIKEARTYALPFYDDYLATFGDYECTDIIGLYDKIF